MAKAEKDKIHYVDNKEFLKAMKEHRKAFLKSKKEGTPKPRVSEYIGECILKIAQKLANKSNFINYTFREDMINDGIENCLMYINNFNPNKSKQPFAYFTQIVYYAFIRRIAREKKHLYTKFKMIEQAMTNDFFETNEDSPVNAPTKYGSEHSNNYMHEFMDNFEKHKNEKKAKTTKKKKKSLEKFLE